MRFKVGDKVILRESSKYYLQQSFDENGRPIPKIISMYYNGADFNYATEDGYSYDDVDLEPYLEKQEPYYEIY